jgi:MYXO-CTERM domain-containing protein
MKSFQWFSRVAASVGTLGVAVIALSASSVAEAGVTCQSYFTRSGSASGLGNLMWTKVDIFADGVGEDAVTAATRPNGASDWPNSFGIFKRVFGPLPENGATDADMIAWNEANFRGTWSVTQSTSGTRSIDTTSLYVPEASLVYPELTSESAIQWENILANHLVGTFTFNLKAAAGQRSNWVTGSNSTFDQGQIQQGATSFSVTISSALSSGFASLAVFQLNRSALGVDLISSIPQTVYSNYPPVPAPGALALLALAGAAGGRRRRG